MHFKKLYSWITTFSLLLAMSIPMTLPLTAHASEVIFLGGEDVQIVQDIADDKTTNSEISANWTKEDWKCLGRMTGYERKAYFSYIKKERETSAMFQDIADASNGYMAGYMHRVKTPHSLYEKLYLRPEKANIDEISDIIRYTEILPENEYVSGVKAVLEKFNANGWSVNTLWNAWTDSSVPYKGVNVELKDDNGHRLEIQFHTDHSFEVKNSEEDHKLYEQRRLLAEGSSEYNTILNMQKELYSSIVTPDGVNWL